LQAQAQFFGKSIRLLGAIPLCNLIHWTPRRTRALFSPRRGSLAVINTILRPRQSWPHTKKKQSTLSVLMRIKFYGILLCAHTKLQQVRLKIQICYTHTQRHTNRLLDLCLVHTARCTRLHQLWLHQLYLNLAVRRDYSSPGRTGSTSILPCAASTRLSAAAALHRLRRRDIIFWAYDYLDDLPLLVSTRKLVEEGSRDINN
jgi:hypothetical protein